MAVVVSEPLRELVGGGENAKYIKECTEMYLCGKGIEKIRGFEPFVNLESLWINGNKLKKLNNLDNQKRLKALYAHDNQICTLKGSLIDFKFLEILDLSNNQLRDLEKQIKVLEKFKFLHELNLKGNPMCEEPDYRHLVIHRMPALKVLDQHVITPLERRKAAGLIGGDVATLTVAFGKRVPPYDPAWDEKVAERSILEQEMSKEATSIRENMRHEAYMRERGMLMHDPHPEPPRGSALPPNAGTVRAMQVYMARDKLVLYTLRAGHDPLAGLTGAPPGALTGPAAVALTKPPPGSIRFEQQEYEHFLQDKAAGVPGWHMNKTVVQL
ncbi:hypothetical protein VOLCADRAFT_120248 [Volvox carteri f. nagariensis]|uniref:Uncharacterized protein n=1 Tax=Volvox carteri f. nagariensis TaxID=3068 RepID=D8TIT4_VOLCA|nr:uncharacterized protein VOLCADRAFT_120248 [Volvox carteri f. nagariensis]EFJ52944.1 hypothetical protein VOLCADRAFT_120248 [Volvox carteri f. nagariensis]|eukprot:XP_002945949.1 hypothetical protein VOLCADRAFT_120248 [Volvox carteri f. nagariensis]